MGDTQGAPPSAFIYDGHRWNALGLWEGHSSTPGKSHRWWIRGNVVGEEPNFLISGKPIWKMDSSWRKHDINTKRNRLRITGTPTVAVVKTKPTWLLNRGWNLPPSQCTNTFSQALLQKPRAPSSTARSKAKCLLTWVPASVLSMAALPAFQAHTLRPLKQTKPCTNVWGEKSNSPA